MTKLSPMMMLGGDILLFRGRGITNALRPAQRVLRQDFTTPAFSHAILSLGSGVVIDAVKAVGVEASSVFDRWEEGNQRWRVFRNQRLLARFESDWPQSAQELSSVAEYFLGQSYSFRTSIAKDLSKSRSFCSELVGRVYAQIGLPFRRTSRKLLPIDISREVVEEPWFEVTETWRATIEDPKYEELRATISKDSKTMIRAIEATRRNSVQVKAIERVMKDYGERRGIEIPSAGLDGKYWDLSESDS